MNANDNLDPIDVVHMRLHAARAMLDVLLELTYAKDAEERLESLGPKSLSTLVHTAIENLDQAAEAVDNIIPAKKAPTFIEVPASEQRTQ